MHSKKYYIIYGLFFSLFVAAVLCLCLTIVPGMPHIDPRSEERRVGKE